jgi:hypothetical protein
VKNNKFVYGARGIAMSWASGDFFQGRAKLSREQNKLFAEITKR